MKNQLEVLISAKTYELTSGKVTLKPFKFALFNEVMRLIQKYFNIFTEGKEIEVTNEDGSKESVLVDKSTAEIVSELLEKSQDDYLILQDLCYLLGLSTGLTPEDIGELSYDEVFFLLSEMFELNRDFFNRIMKKVNPPKPTPDKGKAAKIGESELAD